MYLSSKIHDKNDSYTRMLIIKDYTGFSYAYMSYRSYLRCWIIERRDIEHLLPANLLPYRFATYTECLNQLLSIMVYMNQNKEKFYESTKRFSY
jgi:hypothetical protein